MKALLLSLVLICACVPVSAGEIPVTPAPCKDNCGQSATTLSPLPLKAQIILAILGLLPR